jgi:hypothetical protein
LRALTRRAAPPASVTDAVDEYPRIASSALAQLFFAVGHVALKQLVHAEAIQEQVKKARAVQHEKESKGKKQVCVCECVCASVCVCE